MCSVSIISNFPVSGNCCSFKIRFYNITKNLHIFIWISKIDFFSIKTTTKIITTDITNILIISYETDSLFFSSFISNCTAFSDILLSQKITNLNTKIIYNNLLTILNYCKPKNKHF
ncbi:hypothetical protein EDEG_00713 [Edhazardia aedis USNM 41457]|uniref:Uncharacterized protein n=1 Tax=Edhazardia aedis (strain USNM 41457) TaxID=1003232 RepID=J9A018_EDHAE|nr:hypothetical protein EDEG_00713 [Edhazardia aedis USNM 41457]|eukprot:EJW05248.1 hypothetical protein EDEG_00713 [Edhazardia aedis USNM 41457]